MIYMFKNHAHNLYFCVDSKNMMSSATGTPNIKNSLSLKKDNNFKDLHEAFRALASNNYELICSSNSVEELKHEHPEEFI